MVKAKADLCIEVSWEACNKVGGIYTVVKSKVERMLENYEDYLLIGPYFQDKAKFEVQPKAPPDYLRDIFDDLAKEGIICYFGKWITKGEPSVILIDFHNIIKEKDRLKGDLYRDYGIDSIASHWDFEEPMLWSYAAAKLITKIRKSYKKKMVTHFHEWLAGLALLFQKKMDPKIPTVFTTHATMLGRALAGSGADLYSMVKDIDPQKEAYNSGVQDKFLTEKACAYTADTFTTVSETTSMEAKAVFGKPADILVLNGLDIEKFPSWEELAIKHQQLRDHMREFCASYFFPYYKFDLSESLFYFIIGRYEFKNKGIDIFIKSLGRMNEMMKKENSNKTVISFFFVPAGVNGIKVEILENADEYEKMFDLIDRNLESIKTKIVLNLMHGNDINKRSLFSEEFLNDIKKLMMKFEAKGNPSLVTHNLFNENEDQIIRAFHESGLQNREEDKVKVIFYPVYLDGADGLMDLKYYDAITAGHLGIFPSYYEPWGYTPLEANALGVPAVTTDLSGFGKFMEKKADLKKGGLFILKRQDRSDDQAVDDFTKVLHDYTRNKHKDRVMQKLRSKELSELADWKELISNYIEAHNKAIKKQED